MGAGAGGLRTSIVPIWIRVGAAALGAGGADRPCRGGADGPAAGGAAARIGSAVGSSDRKGSKALSCSGAARAAIGGIGGESGSGAFTVVAKVDGVSGCGAIAAALRPGTSVERTGGCEKILGSACGRAAAAPFAAADFRRIVRSGAPASGRAAPARTGSALAGRDACVSVSGCAARAIAAVGACRGGEVRGARRRDPPSDGETGTQAPRHRRAAAASRRARPAAWRTGRCPPARPVGRCVAGRTGGSCQAARGSKRRLHAA